MTLRLDHTIVPSRDKEKASAFIARILDVQYKGVWRGFAMVQINEFLTLDFADVKDFNVHHFAFLASDEEFDAIVRRLIAESREIETNELHKGRGVYFECDDKHIWEVITHTYVIDPLELKVPTGPRHNE